MKEAPVQHGPHSLFQQRIAQTGRLHLQRCDGCAMFFFPPRVLCPHCGSLEHAWVPASGNGTVYATTTVRSSDASVPDWNVAIVELDEGPRMMSGVRERQPGDTAIGDRVRAEVVNGGDGTAVVRFVQGGA